MDLGGVNAALKIRSLVSAADADITVIDIHDYHLYYPYLYEAATSDEETLDLEDIHKISQFYFTDILPKSITFVQGKVEQIHATEKTITLLGEHVSTSPISYDYLVVALGATTDYFGIAGMAEHALTLKSFTDCMRIRNTCAEIVELHREDTHKPLIRIIVGGGGFSGVELAGEMVNLIKILAWKNQYPIEKIELMVIEGMNQLLPGMDKEVSARIHERLHDHNVQIRLNNFIKQVDTGHLTVSTGEIINYDLLIWTGGVRSARIPFVEQVSADPKDRVSVDDHCAVIGLTDAYVIGDNASILGPDKRPQPQTAQQAMYQAGYVGTVIAAKILGTAAPAPYMPKQFGLIVPITGKWAALKLSNGFTWYGYFAWLAHVYAYARYAARFFGWPKAIEMAYQTSKYLGRNDSAPWLHL